ncbi:sperm acrosome associated 6 [Cricetulus griseus]
MVCGVGGEEGALTLSLRTDLAGPSPHTSSCLWVRVGGSPSRLGPPRPSPPSLLLAPIIPSVNLRTCRAPRAEIRTQDVSYFRDLPGARGNLARIRPVQPTHRGTFSCVILHDQRPLARLYFYLNVTGPPPPGETELQVTFREVMRWTPREAEMIEPWRPSLGELLAKPRALTLGNLVLLAATAALLSASVTVLVCSGGFSFGPLNFESTFPCLNIHQCSSVVLR